MIMSSISPVTNTAPSNLLPVSELDPKNTAIEIQQPTPAQVEETRKANEAAIEILIKKMNETVKSIDTTISTFIDKQMSKPKDAATADISWPVRSAWEKISSLWKEKPAEDPLLVERLQLQQAIEGKGDGSEKNWLERTRQEVQDTVEKLKKNELDKEGLEQFNQKMGRVFQLVNKPLPNQELPLHYAAKSNNAEAVKILLALSALPFLKTPQGTILEKDRHGQTIFDYVGLSENEEVKLVLIQYFQNLGKQWFQNVIENMTAKKIPLSPQMVEFAEQNVYKQVNEIFSEFGRKITLSDPLAPSMTEWIKFGMIVSLAATWGFGKLLNANDWTPDNSFIAKNTDNYTQIIALLANHVQSMELFSGFVMFTNSFVKSKIPIVPSLMYIGLNILSGHYSPMAQLSSAINTAVLASTIIDTGYVCYQNVKDRPVDVAKKAIVSGVNLATRYTNVFDQFKPKAPAPEPKPCPQPSPELIARATRDNTMEKLIGAELEEEDLPNAVKLLYFPKGCKQAYRDLSRKWHPDKNGQSEQSSYITKILNFGYEAFCKPLWREQMHTNATDTCQA